MAGDHSAHGHNDAGHGDHATDQTYIKVALALAVVTLIEVVIYYLPSFRPMLVPSLIILSVGKFAAVVGYFMHLKYDAKLFRYMFVAGLVLSLAVYLAMLAMFFTNTSFAPFAVTFGG